MKKLRIQVRVPIPLNDDQEPLHDEGSEEERFKMLEGYLHHWGIDSEIIPGRDNAPVGVHTFTVAVIEDIDTGQVHTFHPTQIKILNYETYERTDTLFLGPGGTEAQD